jgi:hypothetical protein
MVAASSRSSIYVIFRDGLWCDLYQEVQVGEQEGDQEEAAEVLIGEVEGDLVEAD